MPHWLVRLTRAAAHGSRLELIPGRIDVSSDIANAHIRHRSAKP
jgi:hypothetical protein